MVRIHLSDGSSCIVPSELAARDDIHAGTTLTPEQLQSLSRRAERLLARRAALRLLARASHTRAGLARKLSARGFGADAVRRALDRMAALGYLDDRRFAEAWLRSRMASSTDGFKALYRGLLRRGVSRSVAEAAVAESCPEEEELVRALRLSQRLSPRSIAARLVSRGYRSRTIARVLKELRSTTPPDGEG